MPPSKPTRTSDDRLDAIQAQLQKMQETFAQMQHDFTRSIDAMQSDVDELLKQGEKLETQMTGGDKPDKGLIVRVDRLENDRSRMQWFMRLTGGALVVAAVGALIGFIKGEK